jgi:aminoglycoside phosphotransferase (APT) family kinase protein
MQPNPAPSNIQDWLHTLAGWSGAIVHNVHRFEGGASNVTCRVDVTGGPVASFVLRLQRERGIFEPYDVLREAIVLRRLAPTPIPVPTVFETEPDDRWLGAPFISMEFVDAPHMGEAGPAASYPAFVRAVAGIHALDWREAGFDVLGVPRSTAAALSHELDAIGGRVDRFVTSEAPELRRALRRLRDTIPADGALTLCQGDINVFNYLFRSGEVVAVVDWEQARISDRRSDLGQLVALADLKGQPFGPADDSPFVTLYGQFAGGPVTGTDWFRARWLCDLAAIARGWEAFNGTAPWFTAAQCMELLDSALRELD